ncbi:hypothetical protein [Vibrio mangrovi]|uniref:Uncharacterized protein n=1 Tax=Vibrio mangrovi TaxID=474394 RepID=A0ABU4IBC9_9VIBR|nr:hypothetical protein [Vibrio mangrovi]MDW6004555.1 hypothetical protein [Vibrio mangrovi]
MSLLCSAIELKTGKDLKTSLQCEQKLYRITSGSGPNDDLTKAGYSLPHHIIQAADQQGLNSALYFLPNEYSDKLMHLYPAAREACERQGVTVNQTALPHPHENQRVLKVLQTASGGLHWVMMRPDQTYMDPATGKDAQSFGQLNQNIRQASFGSESYQETGICLVLTPKQE